MIAPVGFTSMKTLAAALTHLWIVPPAWLEASHTGARLWLL